MISDNQKFNKTIQPSSAFLSDLKIKLPEFFAENGSFDIDKFKNQLDDNNINVQSEGYQLDFVGKNYAHRQAGEMPTTVIVPDEKQNNEAGKNSQNLFLTGDNLEVLRHLQGAYSNKIDVIYIDPPYNTGSDGFVYPDSFEYSDEQLKDMFDLNDAQVGRLKSIQDKSSHSAWLTFMYPRLRLASNLLSDNGIIFVSIDDNEVENLKYLLLSIFGELSFVAQLVWKRRATAPNDNNIGKNHEYILVFSKNIRKMKLGLLPRTGNSLSRYKNQDNDPRGKWVASDLSVNGKGGKLAQSTIYEIENKKTGEKFYPNEGKGWMFSKEKMMRYIEEGRVDFRSTTGKPFLKRYLSEVRNGVTMPTILEDFGFSQDSSKEIKKLFDVNVFDYPKPTKLIKALIRVGLKENEGVVLDFFAGSSTTADAVMQLNAEDGGHRKFIMVQLPEKTYKVDQDTGKPILDKRGQKIPTKGGKAAYDAGFKSIDQISRERIRRAAKKIKQDNELTLPENFDGSFKHYRVVKPTKQTLENIEDFDPNSTDLFTNMVDSFSSSELNVEGNATGEQTILTTWLAQDGYSFEANIETFDFGEYKAHIVENNRLYLINEGWNQDDTKELLNQLGTHQLDLQSVVVLGYSFNIAELRELEIGLKQLDSHVNLIRRY